VSVNFRFITQDFRIKQKNVLIFFISSKHFTRYSIFHLASSKLRCFRIKFIIVIYVTSFCVNWAFLITRA
jgi:hypothetical protein